MNDPPSEYLQGNIDAWQKKAVDYAKYAEEAWASDHPYWGIWGIRESNASFLPKDMSGLTCIELGCGTAYVSAWMCRRGAKVVAIDPTHKNNNTNDRFWPFFASCNAAISAQLPCKTEVCKRDQSSRWWFLRMTE